MNRFFKVSLLFGLLALLTVSLFWWRGHYSLRLTFWDELLEILKGLLLAALLMPLSPQLT